MTEWQQHPIEPSPELVKQWLGEYFGTSVTGEISDVEHVLAAKAARWGADQELEACCEWLEQDRGRWELPAPLRAARRPKPPSLKVEAIAVLDELDGLFELPAGHYNTILRALEKLDDSL